MAGSDGRAFKDGEALRFTDLLLSTGVGARPVALKTKTMQAERVITYGDAKQGPLDGRPSVLPAIDDQDETHVC